MDQEMNEAIECRTQDTSSKAVGKLREFCSGTTAHGFGRLASSTSTLEKLLWSACLLAALGYMTYQGIILVSDYLSYPVDVKVELKYHESLDFPAVVVCNMNMVKKSARKKAIEQGMMPDEDLMDIWQRLGGKNNRKVLSSWKDAMLASLDANTKKFIGHQAEDFIVGCHWKGEICGPKNFTFLYNFVYGNCYVFSEKDNTKNITEPGSENGLSLTLNIEADEYLADFSESYGAIVDVTSSKEMHFPEENGYLVAPGQVTNIGFTKRLIKRLGMPYEGTECGGHGQELIYINRTYSETACRKTCVAKNQLAQCGCAEVAYPVKPNCDPFNSTQVLCVKNVSYQIRLAQIKCKCSEDCKLFEYPATISSAIWPTEAYLVRLRNTSNLTERAPKVTSGIVEARKNLAHVNVYYKSMTVEVIQQEQRIWPEDLLGSIGGSLGLFTGVSLLTLMEFFKLLFDLMGYFCRKQPAIVKPATTGKEVGEKVFNS